LAQEERNEEHRKKNLSYVVQNIRNFKQLGIIPCSAPADGIGGRNHEQK
jgi:hypothetical protein